MINFGTSVLEFGGAPFPMFAIQPSGSAEYDVIAPRLRKSGCRFLSPRELVGRMWADTRCSVTIQPAADVLCVTQMHTGSTRLLPTVPVDCSPMFAELVGQGGRLLLALFLPDVLPTIGEGNLAPAELREHFGELTEAAAERRELLAGYAQIRDTPMPARNGRRVM